MNIEMRDALSIHWPLLLAQLAAFLAVAAVFIGLALHATRRVLRRYDARQDETRVVMWIAVTWLLPVLGPLLAMSAAESGSTSRSLNHDQGRSA